MALAIDTAPLLRFVDNFRLDWTFAAWQVGVALGALFLGWCVARAAFHWVKPSARWKFGEGDFERVAFPALAWRSGSLPGGPRSAPG